MNTLLRSSSLGFLKSALMGYSRPVILRVKFKNQPTAGSSLEKKKKSADNDDQQ